MSNRLLRVNCPNCGTTAGTKRATTHWGHLILTILTVGLWLPVWILFAMVNAIGGEVRCNQCGSKAWTAR